MALCIIDGEGEIVLEKALLCEVEDITACLEKFGYPIVRIGFEVGTMSQTLFHGLKAAGYDVVDYAPLYTTYKWLFKKD